MMDDPVLIEAEDLCKFFFVRRRKDLFSLKPELSTVKAVNAVSLRIREGENCAVVGESGSGKTTLGCVLARILEPSSGKVWFQGREITYIQKRDLKELRGMIQMVFQDPGTSLNPRRTIESTLSLPLRIHSSMTGREIKQRIVELLKAVHLPPEVMVQYPGSLSGGQKQRVNLARAIALSPRLLVLDEPTSALDVSVQAKILRLLAELKEKLGLTYVLISHDFSVVKNLADRIAVMYLGRIVELGSTSTLFNRPIHPYTKALLSAIPVISEEERGILPEEVILEGDIPSPANPPVTCPFFSRCQERKARCETSPCPDLKEVEEGHFVRCFHADGIRS